MKMIKYEDKVNKFKEIFDPRTGFYLRSGIIENNKDTGIDPFMRNFPGLIDVGIMGSCAHGAGGLCAKSGVQCYQNGKSVEKPNMSIVDFKVIVEQCKKKVFQFALGGRGDVNLHERFEDILRLCRENEIVPNFTTSGLGLTAEHAAVCKRYTGAVAVSWYRSNYTLRAIDMLVAAGVKTNIHYVLGRNTIDEAIERLTTGDFPKGVNAVIFLLHKPVGLGSSENVLSTGDMRVKRFFEIIDKINFDFKVGFDSCSCAGILNFSENINSNSIDYCEGARHSCYIDAQMNMMPCSFAADDEAWHVNLRDYSIDEAWHSEPFKRFRHSLHESCPDCKDRLLCGGGCPIANDITLCDRAERVQASE